MAVDPAPELTFVLDQNLGGSMIEILRLAKARPVGRITTLSELGYPGDADDEDWMADLGGRGDYVAVTRDSKILNEAVRRAAWRSSGIRILLLKDDWGRLPIRELARALLYWWPRMVLHADAGTPGTAWSVAYRVYEPPQDAIRLITGTGPSGHR